MICNNNSSSPKWPQTALSEVADINPRFADVPTNDEIVSFLPMSAVSVDGMIVETDSRKYSEVAKGFTPFLPGDVLVAKITPCFQNGKIALATISRRLGFGSTEFHVVRPRDGRLDRRYAYHFLRQDYIRCAGERRMTGSAGQRRVPEAFLAELEIPLPPLAEQRRIAEVLDRAEALRAKRRAALAQLDSLTQSIFLDMFGDPATNPKRLTYRPLGEYLLFMTSGGRRWADYYVESGARFIRSLDVQMNFISDDEPAFVAPPDNAEARRTSVKSGDVLLTITGSRIGRVAAVPCQLDGAYISQHVTILRVESSRIEPRYLAFFLSLECGGQRQIARSQYGQTKPGLNFEQIRRFDVPVPCIDLQREFIRRIDTVETLKRMQTESLHNMDSLFASLQHRAFRGEL